MLLDDEMYNAVWDRVYTQLHFKPSCYVRTHTFDTVMPFEIDDKFAVYGIEGMSDTQLDEMENTIRNILIAVSAEGDRLYALDWQHSGFLFDPRNESEQKSIWIQDERSSYDGYYAHFPSFYPDGDYYFFIDENFCFGYLGHPWRQEVWVFGEILLDKFEQVYSSLGWTKLK